MEAFLVSTLFVTCIFFALHYMNQDASDFSKVNYISASPILPLLPTSSNQYFSHQLI